MKKIILPLIFLLFCMNFLFSQNKFPNNNRNKTEKTRIFFFALASFSSYFPSEYDTNDLHDGRIVGVLSPVFGGGFTFLNFWNRGFINFEMDYSFNRFDTSDISNRKIGTLSLNLTAEWKIGRNNSFSAFGGIGLGFIHNSEYDFTDYNYEEWLVQEDTELTVSLISGIKYMLGRRLSLRTELKFYMINDEYSYNYEDNELRQMQISTGLEIYL